MNDITLQQIEIFLTVAEQLSLSEAAKDLFINQSAVSRWIQRLETSLATKLFRRNNRGVELTDHGEFLYNELKPIFEKLGHTLQTLRSMYDIKDNILRIGCIDSSEVLGALREAVRDFEMEYPDTLLKIELFDFTRLREELVCGNLDCIVSYSLGMGEYWNIVNRKIKRLDTYLGISARSPLASSREIPVEALNNEALYLLYIAEMKDPEVRALETCRKIGFTPREICYMPSYFALDLAVKNGRGISIGGVNLQDHFGSDIKLYHVRDPGQEQYVMLSWRESNCSALTRAFINTIREIRT